MQAGCIVFAKNYSNNKELIENGINGFLFEKENQNIVKTIYDLEKMQSTLVQFQKMLISLHSGTEWKT